jgi:hypothetical protein
MIAVLADSIPKTISGNAEHFLSFIMMRIPLVCGD